MITPYVWLVGIRGGDELLDVGGTKAKSTGRQANGADAAIFGPARYGATRDAQPFGDLARAE